MTTTLRGDDNFDSATPIGAGNFTAKAWVSFDGTGTVAILRSANTSSITDVGAGDYTQNFQNIMSSQHYSVSGSAKSYDSTITNMAIAGASLQVNTTSGLRILTTGLNTSAAHRYGSDSNYVAMQTYN